MRAGIVGMGFDDANRMPDLCGTDFAGREGDAPTYARIMPEIGVY